MESLNHFSWLIHNKIEGTEVLPVLVARNGDFPFQHCLGNLCKLFESLSQVQEGDSTELVWEIVVGKKSSWGLPVGQSVYCYFRTPQIPPPPCLSSTLFKPAPRNSIWVGFSLLNSVSHLLFCFSFSNNGNSMKTSYSLLYNGLQHLEQHLSQSRSSVHTHPIRLAGAISSVFLNSEGPAVS